MCGNGIKLLAGFKTRIIKNFVIYISLSAIIVGLLVFVLLNVEINFYLVELIAFVLIMAILFVIFYLNFNFIAEKAVDMLEKGQIILSQCRRDFSKFDCVR